MRRAGDRAAFSVIRHFPEALSRGVLVVAGPGNNGGDGWVVASALVRAGYSVSVEAVAPTTPDAIAAKEAFGSVAPRIRTGGDSPAVVIDAVLGTGTSGPIRSTLEGLTKMVSLAREQGSLVVALDVPSGLNASTGQADPRTVPADLTLSFGTFKRGQLIRRDLCGELRCVDIGLAEHAHLPDSAAELVDADSVRRFVPVIPASAHKGSRKRLVIVGGAPGMAGAVAFAARAAFRSGIGMVRCVVAPESLPVVQTLCPQATATSWLEPLHDSVAWGDGLVIGPGLGSHQARPRVDAWLSEWRGPLLLDADALTAFTGDVGALATHLAGRQALVTPHAGEASRLLGEPVEKVVEAPFESAEKLAAALGAAVLLKGVPTIVAAPGVPALVSARGTPVLAAGGSGDLLSGIAGTLLAQTGDPQQSGACAAWVHGRAAEIAQGGGPIRGVELHDILDALRAAWNVVDSDLAEWELGALPSLQDSRGR